MTDWLLGSFTKKANDPLVDARFGLQLALAGLRRRAVSTARLYAALAQHRAKRLSLAYGRAGRTGLSNFLALDEYPPPKPAL